MELTIITPTYNRAHCLMNLFDSLEKQSNKSFEWLVIDDGSSDNTQSLIEHFTDVSSFPIRYFFKENGGKHTALNLGIQIITTKLTFIVDSDDMLTADAVDTILNYNEKYGTDTGICGYSFLRMFPDGKINGKKFCKDDWKTSLIEARINNDDTNSDKAEVYFTDVLRKFPFPEYAGEKFLGEDIVWIRIAKEYEMIHINKGIYIGQYIDEGLTKNRRIHNIKSPVGCMNRAKEFMSPKIKFRYRLKGAIQYIVYGKFAGCSLRDLIEGAPDKILVGIATIPSLILFKMWHMKYS